MHTRYHNLAVTLAREGRCVRCQRNDSAEGTLHCTACLVYFRNRYVLPEKRGTGKRTGRPVLSREAS